MYDEWTRISDQAKAVEIEMRREAREEGREEGRMLMLIDMIKDEVISLEEVSERYGIPVEVLEEELRRG